MSDNSKISWCDATWNAVTGCTEVSPGCAHCYAKTFAERWRGLKGHYYENGFDVQLRPNMLDRPLHWKKARRIFVNSMSDLFHEDVPDGYIMRVYMTMARAPQHTFQILTKRIERAFAFLDRLADLTGEVPDPQLVRGPEATRATHPSGRGQLFADYLDALGEPPPGAAYPTFDWMEGLRWWPFRAVLPNVLIGPTIENQHFANVRLPVLAKIKALGWRTMVSYEPALGPVNFWPWLEGCDHIDLDGTGVDHEWRCNGCGVVRRDVEVASDGDAWVTDLIGHRRDYQLRYEYLTPEPKACIDWLICGGESGADRRTFDHQWARDALAQARGANIPFFMKQDSALRSEVYDTLPDDLKVREFPR